MCALCLCESKDQILTTNIFVCFSFFYHFVKLCVCCIYMCLHVFSVFGGVKYNPNNIGLFWGLEPIVGPLFGRPYNLINK